MSNEKAEQLHSEMAERSNKRMDSWTRREERREIYMMVAEILVRDHREGASLDCIERISDKIYQGMIKFCGEAK